MAGAPKGNQNAANGKRFGLVAQRIAAEDKYKALEDSVRAMFEKARAGDLKAIEMVRDTLDGKPSQAIKAEVDGNLTVNIKRFCAGD